MWQNGRDQKEQDTEHIFSVDECQQRCMHTRCSINQFMKSPLSDLRAVSMSQTPAMFRRVNCSSVGSTPSSNHNAAFTKAMEPPDEE
mmetsp:Transcript_23402/g.66286  ORF Transcript_23402/g.66286 Transcript_23402/m.66286 type:complete len:87 (+) Transcript_23402:1072-1332(+)